MKIYKVINNNMVSIYNGDGQEVMLKGLSIGFNKKPGDFVDESKIEKKFVLENQQLIRQFDSIVMSLDKNVVDACIDVISDIKKHSKVELADSIYVTIVDHINNLIDRMNEGIKFDNSILWDLKRIYSDEFVLAKNAIAELNQRLTYELPDDEANFITLHIVNAEKSRSMNETYKITDCIGDICAIVKSELPLDVSDEDYYYNRFIMHLRFMLENQGNRMQGVHKRNNIMLQSMVVLYPVIWQAVEKIVSYVKANLNWDLSNDEKLYLIIHLVQIFHR
ncbi:PRD domain-containing protein [Anaerorhabdus sp.]|uniref:PRD domain-containing protein n=1 Tax=Anaerorhabdus sp. TaxID=1872524 RepID=UPI002FC7D630